MQYDLLTKALTLSREAKARADAATPGPWIRCRWGEHDPSPGRCVSALDADGVRVWDMADCDRDEDAEFVSHARTDVPALASLVEQLVAEVADLRDRVKTESYYADTRLAEVQTLYRQLDKIQNTVRVEAGYVSPEYALSADRARVRAETIEECASALEKFLCGDDTPGKQCPCADCSNTHFDAGVIRALAAKGEK